jgi:uncharacterized protein
MPCCASLTDYIESRLFLPPHPLVVFPADFDRLRWAVPQVCTDLYFELGVASIGVHHSAPKHTIVYAHGNNENLLRLTDFVQTLSSTLAADVFAVEYPGYSSGTGEPGEATCNDAVAAYTRAMSTRARAPLVLLGYSMGCAPALHAAVAVAPSALVLMAPFVSAASTALARDARALRWHFLWAAVDVFRTLPLARKAACPTLVLHGAKDGVIPVAHGRAVAAALKQGTYEELADETHGSLQQCPAALDKIKEWLAQSGS